MKPVLSSEPKSLTLTNDPYRFLLYGDFGRRKTTFGGTCPKPLWIDTNGGLVTLGLQGVSEGMTWTPEGHKDLEALYWWIKARVDENDIDTIIIDTIDNLCMQLMGEISDDFVKEKMASGKKISLRMQLVPDLGDYYANQKQMFSFLTALKALGKHIILLSSLRTAENGRTAPNVSKGMESVICDFVSLVGEMIIIDEADLEGEDDPNLYAGCGVMLTAESNSRATKSRYRSIKPYVVDPTFDKLHKLIQDEFRAAQDEH